MEIPDERAIQSNRFVAFKTSHTNSETGIETMTSVLNVGVMPTNPVGNQIRSLESALEAERKDKAMLLLALETKAPTIYTEYVRLKEEEGARLEAASRAAELARNPPPSAPPRFAPNMNRGRGF